MPPVTIPDLPPAPGTAWLFPGQGAQHVGMGKDLYEHVPAARAVFEAADAALGFPLSTLCFEGPEDELVRTVNTQPALVTHAIAALVAAIEAGSVTGRPDFVAGHSLGEYAALIAAGAVSFEDGVRLVRERGRLMQEACDAEPGDDGRGARAGAGRWWRRSARRTARRSATSTRRATSRSGAPSRRWRRRARRPPRRARCA